MMLVELRLTIAGFVESAEGLECLKRDMGGIDWVSLRAITQEGEDPEPIVTGGYNPISLHWRPTDSDEWIEA